MAAALQGQVAIVTGASRGVGKGVALGLGEAGATVYVTGRTVEAGTGTFPGSITETAADVTRLGGRGIAVRCDHANDAEVAALFQRVKDEQGRLDILVNNAFPTPAGKMPVGVPFWELPIAVWDDIQTIGLRSHFVASWHAAPMMVAERRGLIVEISSGGAARYSLFLAYGVGKAGQDRLTADMAHELRPHNVAAVSLWPGPVKSEKNLAQPDRFSPEMMEQFEKYGESAQFTGRAVAALAADPNVMAKTGQVLVVADIAEQYGFTDIDGRRPLPRYRAGVGRIDL